MPRRDPIAAAFFSLGALLLLAAAVPPAAGQELCEDRIYAASSADTIRVLHAGAWYNCCVAVETALEVPEPFVLDFLETETYPEGPCFCMCCFDLSLGGSGVAPGLYTVRVWNEDRSVLYGSAEVEVLPPAGRDDPALLETFQSDCLDVVSVPPPSGPSWGRIKKFFR